jgi:hypothetical protein
VRPAMVAFGGLSTMTIDIYILGIYEVEDAANRMQRVIEEKLKDEGSWRRAEPSGGSGPGSITFRSWWLRDCTMRIVTLSLYPNPSPAVSILTNLV